MLKSIQNTGKTNSTTAAMPPVVFGGVQMANHVEGSGPDNLRYIKWRLRTIKSETGSTLTVNYSDPGCIWGTSMPAAVDKNTRRCFPVKWSQSGAEPVTDWFHKYVVTSVFQDDPYGQGDTGETRYDFRRLQRAAFRKIHPVHARPERREGTRRHSRGGEGHRLHRHRHRRLASVRRLRPRDERLQRHRGSQRNHQHPLVGSHAYSWGTTESWIVQAGEATTRTKTSTGTRTVKQKTTYDTTYGMPLTVEDSGDAAKSGDESCVGTTFARNTSAWIA